MPTGACAVGHAYADKSRELQRTFESGVVKVNAVDVGLTRESFDRMQDVRRCPFVYVACDDGDYLLAEPAKYDMREAPVEVPYPQELFTPGAESVRGYISEVE